MNLKQTLLVNLVRPLVARMGTVAATYLLALGFSEGQIGELLAAASAFALVVIDLLLSSYYRRLETKEAD